MSTKRIFIILVIILFLFLLIAGIVKHDTFPLVLDVILIQITDMKLSVDD